MALVRTRSARSGGLSGGEASPVGRRPLADTGAAAVRAPGGGSPLEWGRGSARPGPAQVPPSGSGLGGGGERGGGPSGRGPARGSAPSLSRAPVGLSLPAPRRRSVPAGVAAAAARGPSACGGIGSLQPRERGRRKHGVTPASQRGGASSCQRRFNPSLSSAPGWAGGRWPEEGAVLGRDPGGWATGPGWLGSPSQEVGRATGLSPPHVSPHHRFATPQVQPTPARDVTEPPG